MEIKKLIEEFDDDIIRMFIQKNSDYYIAKWKVMAASGSKFSWNWASFLATSLWFGYRKMYLYAFIFILLTLLEFIPFIGIIVWLVLWIGMGALGNYLYGKFTYNKLVELKMAFPDQEEFKSQVAKAGGTSTSGIFIVMLMTFIIYILLLVIGTALYQPYSYTGF